MGGARNDWGWNRRQGDGAKRQVRVGARQQQVLKGWKQQGKQKKVMQSLQKGMKASGREGIMPDCVCFLAEISQTQGAEVEWSL